MRKVNAVFGRVVKELLNDKRTLILMFIAPLFIMAILNFLFSSTTSENANLGVKNVDHVVVTNLKNKHLKIKKVRSQQSAEQIIRNQNLDGLLTQKDHKLTLTLQNTDQSKKAVILQGIQKAQIKLRMKASASIIKSEQKALKQMSQQMQKVVEIAAKSNPRIVAEMTNSKKQAKNNKQIKGYKIKTKYLYGNKNTNYFDSLLPIMISFIVFFFVFLISGMSLFDERNRGTLGRILATPIRKIELISGYVLGYGLFAIIQTIEIVLFTIYVFNLEVKGSIWLILLINILVAFVALSLGLLLSAFANSEFQMMQFIPLIVIPQIFFSGVIPVSTMQSWLQALAHIIPLYYAGGSILDVVQKGTGLFQIGFNCLILLAFGICFMIGAVITMRKYREV